MNTITVTVSVNQQESIRRGIGSDSTVKLTLDLDPLTPEQRGMIANSFRDGRLHISPIPVPTVEGVLEVVNGYLDSKREEAAKQAREAQELSARIESGEKGVWVSVYDISRLSPRALEMYRAEREEAKRISDLAEARQREEREAREAEERAEKQARDAARTKRVETWIASHPGIFADRYNAGYATQGEVISKIRDEERAARGVSLTGDMSDWSRDDLDEISTLTDEQFCALTAFRSLLPPDAEITLWDIHNHPEDEHGDQDSDKKTDRIVVADARWLTTDGIEITADAQIGTLPDVE